MINESLKEMYDKAIKEDLWFFTNYQQMWFSPKELAEENANGHFRWGPTNWTLRSPRELIEQRKDSLRKTADFINNIYRRIEEQKIESDSQIQERS